MLLFVGDNTDSSSVTTTRHHHRVTCVVLDHLSYLSCGDINDHSVVDLSITSRSSNGSCVVGNQVMDSFYTSTDLLHLAELVACFISSNAVTNETSFHVIEESEELPSFLDSDDIHESSRVCFVRTYTTVYLDQALHHDLSDIRVSECILEPVS